MTLPACRHRAVAWIVATLLVAASAQLASAEEPLKNFVVNQPPKPIPAISFEDEQRQKRSLADFNGKVVILTIWATWCVPCREEMPALDRLQAALGGPEFAVVPLSIDRGIEKITKFYAEIGIRNLPIYIDVAGRAPRDLGAVGVPTTLILDRAGQEVGRVVGPAQWDASEVVEFLKPIIAKQTAPIEQASRDDDGSAAQSAGPLARSWHWLKALFVK
jgi:thiol-disulfide isomerase/thioredoxin